MAKKRKHIIAALLGLASLKSVAHADPSWSQEALPGYQPTTEEIKELKDSKQHDNTVKTAGILSLSGLAGFMVAAAALRPKKKKKEPREFPM